MTANRPLRVCFPFVGDSIGGSHFSALTLIGALDRREVEPVIVLHQEGPFSRHLEAEGIAWRRLPLARLLGRDSSWSGHLRALVATVGPLVKFLRAERIDLVHSNDTRIHLTWALPARLAGAAQVWHQRNVQGHSRLNLLALRLPRRIVAISEFVASGLPAFARTKTRVLHNPVAAPEDLDRAACREALLEELGLPGETKLVGWFGNLIAWKRPEVFVEAAIHLKQRHDAPLAFLVFGEDREGLRPGLEARAREAGVDLRFMGFRQPVLPLMAGCDAILATARKEPFGRTLAESMLAGTPVVATAEGGHLEVAAEPGTARLVTPGDPAALAEAARDLLSDGDGAARQSEAARKMARRRFAPSAHAVAMTALYREAAGVAGEAEIALVISDLAPGGAQRVLLGLARGWAAAGRKVRLITLDEGNADAFALPAGVERVALGLQRPSRNRLEAQAAGLQRVLALRRAIKASGAPAVLSFVGATNVLTVLAGLGLGKRIVVSERNDPARQPLGWPWESLRRRLYRRANLVTANSRGALETLAGFVPREKLRLLPNPLAVPENVSPEPFAAPTLLAIGRLHRQKGLDILLAAFARSRARGQGWRLLIVGDGGEGDALKRQAEALGIGAAVEWRDHVADPFPLYAGAAALVLASRYEGTPNVVLEALALGRPVILSEGCGGALDLVEDSRSALIVPVEDPNALAAAMDRLAADPAQAERLGAAGRDAVTGLSPEKVLPLWSAALALDRSHDAAPSAAPLKASRSS